MSVSSLSAALQRLQDILKAVLILGLLWFPLILVAWELLMLVAPQAAIHPLVQQFFSGFDAAGQLPMARSVFRIWLCFVGVVALMLPVGQAKGRSQTSALWVLALGLISAAFSVRVAAAELEWECWALLLIVAYALRASPIRLQGAWAAAALYILISAVAAHAFLLSVLGAGGRLVGVFHHPNIMSTFCLMSLPFPVWRATVPNAPDSTLASLLAGLLSALLVWTGSLTGVGVLAVLLTFWLSRGHILVRLILAASAFTMPVLCNLVSGRFAQAAMGLCLALLLAGAWYRHRKSLSLGATACLLSSFVLTLVVLIWSSPDMGGGGSAVSRDNSVTARVHFYRAGLSMLAQNPLLGVGPGGFAHEYPRFQGSVTYFSKFLHCLPLGLAVEWGVPAFLLAVVGTVAWVRGIKWDQLRVPGGVVGSTLVAFSIHCLSGVQDQFPYLFAYLIVAYHLSKDSDSGEEISPEKALFSLGRLVLSVALLGLALLNGTRLSSQFDRAIGYELYRRMGPAAGAESLALLSLSASTTPGDEQAWFQWALLCDAQGQTTASVPLAQRAIELDTRWAAPRELEMRGNPEIAAERVQQALAIDPVNYPAFYTVRAEILLRDGKPADALKLLQARAGEYSPVHLAKLPEFRSDDLNEQMVDFWMAAAVAAEAVKDEKEAERAFRRALDATGNQVARLKRLTTYPQRRRLEAGPMISALIEQVRGQLKP